jgi:hypothetical protein
MILEGSSTMKNGLITGLRIRGICEGSAEARLTRLLRRKKFEEAEKFAKMNRLSLEEVHHVRINFSNSFLIQFAKNLTSEL